MSDKSRQNVVRAAASAPETRCATELGTEATRRSLRQTFGEIHSIKPLLDHTHRERSTGAKNGNRRSPIRTSLRLQRYMDQSRGSRGTHAPSVLIVEQKDVSVSSEMKFGKTAATVLVGTELLAPKKMGPGAPGRAGRGAWGAPGRLAAVFKKHDSCPSLPPRFYQIPDP